MNRFILRAWHILALSGVILYENYLLGMTSILLERQWPEALWSFFSSRNLVEPAWWQVATWFRRVSWGKNKLITNLSARSQSYHAFCKFYCCWFSFLKGCIFTFLGTTMESPKPAEIRTIRENYKQALQCLSSGLQYDEVGNKDQALRLYKLGRRHLLRGLEVNTHGERCVGRHWDFARQTQLKMNETLSTITDRLGVLESTANSGQRLYPTLPVLQDPQPVVTTRASVSASGGASAHRASPTAGFTAPAELPPAYTPQPTEGHMSLSHRGNGQFHAAPNQTPQRQAFAPVNLSEAGKEMMFLPSGVQMFFVSAEGHVSAPSYPGFLRIIIYNSQNSNDNYAPAYLQVNIVIW